MNFYTFIKKNIFRRQNGTWWAETQETRKCFDYFTSYWPYTVRSLLNLHHKIKFSVGDCELLGLDGATGLQCFDQWLNARSQVFCFAFTAICFTFITVSITAEWLKLTVLILVIVFTITRPIGFSEPYKKTYASVSWWHMLIIKCLWIYGHFMTESIWL